MPEEAPSLGATIDTVEAYTWHCNLCKVESADLTINREDIKTMVRIHNQLAKHTLGYGGEEWQKLQTIRLARAEVDDGGLPKHLKMGLTIDNQGPADPPDPRFHHWGCWCGDNNCPKEFWETNANP